MAFSFILPFSLSMIAAATHTPSPRTIYLLSKFPAKVAHMNRGINFPIFNFCPQLFIINAFIPKFPFRTRCSFWVITATHSMGIGKDGKLPWRLPFDLKFFKDVTMTTSDPAKKNAIIMGRKTWESITLEHRPLTGCLNVVLTRSGSFDIATTENVLICGSMISALELLASSPYRLSIESVFVIGGGQILRESLNASECDAIHITEIETNIECDTFIPAIDASEFQPWYSSFFFGKGIPGTARTGNFET